MAVLNKDDLIKKIMDYTSGKDDDDTLSLIEDVTDTITSYDGGEDWQKKYNDLDKQWRTRYRERFENGNQIRKDEKEDEINEADMTADTAENDKPEEPEYSDRVKREMEESVFKSGESEEK